MAKRSDHDLVLLKTSDSISQTTAVSFASSEPKNGEAVIVLGNPFGGQLGNNFSGSLGIIGGDGFVKLGLDNPLINTSNTDGAIRTVRTDAAMNPGGSGGLGFRVRDGKMVFIPTFIYPTGLFHGMGFGITSPTIVNDIKEWIQYDFDVGGRFVERKELKEKKDLTRK